MVSIWRFRFLSLLLFFLFLLVGARLFYWQIIKGSQLSLKAQSQYLKITQTRPLRGEIRAFDNFPLAGNAPGFLVFANPREVKEKKEAPVLIQKLPSILEMNPASITASLNQDLVWALLKNKIDIKTKEKIESLNLSGLGFERQDLRFYPEASLAAHLLGFVGKDEDGNDKGYFGLEGYYDRELKGRLGRIKEVKDVQGRPILLAEKTAEEKLDGQNLVLYLDRRVQLVAEEKLKEGVEKYGARGGTVVVMDPKTGGILAAASYPSYDPAKYQEYNEAVFKDPLIAEAYEPGSTFKVLVMASALEEKAVSAETQCDSCRGPVTIGDYTIRNWNNKYFPNTNMIGVIEHSDNTGMVFVSQKLGLNKLFNDLKKFGIGSLSGIDLQGEANISLRAEKNWYPIDLATASFGQGIAVTPIQMLVAVASLANDGKLMEPHVVSKIIDSGGRETIIKPRVVREVISQNTAKIITEMMVKAVDNGEAKWAKPKGFRIAGKTGTSQIPISGHYDPTKTVASFVGFAPADDPKFVILVKINEPTSSIYGSETAAPIFFQITRDLLNYYNIPPKE